MSDISVIGLGAMGTPIARNLLDAGYRVTVWNRSPEPAHPLATRARVSRLEWKMPSIPRRHLDALERRGRHRGPAGLGVLRYAAAGTVHVNMATISTALAARAAGIHADHDSATWRRRCSAESPSQKRAR